MSEFRVTARFLHVVGGEGAFLPAQLPFPPVLVRAVDDADAIARLEGQVRGLLRLEVVQRHGVLHRHRQTDTDTDRDTDTDTDTDTDRDRQTHTETETETQTHPDRDTERHTDRDR